MIPTFLKEFASQIDKSRLETIRIMANPIENVKSLSIKQSKFLGNPFLPIQQEYPKNKFGKPMILMAQINFQEMPPLLNYPQKGIFQVFTSAMFWDLGEEYFLYLYHENIDQVCHQDFSFLTSDLYEGLPISCEHSLTFSKEVDYGGAKDFRFNPNFNDKSLYEFRMSLTKKEQKEFDRLFRSDGHKIGGYAYFTQQDPRISDREKTNDLLLLQIDTDEKIMFGDGGVSNIFIPANDLKNRNFNKAYFNWDCV